MTLGDETGLSNAVLTPGRAARFRIPLHQAAMLEIAGPLQRVEGVIHVRAREVRALALGEPVKLPPSHDYREARDASATVDEPYASSSAHRR